MWRSEVNIRGFLNYSLSYFLRQGLLLNLEIPGLAKLATWQSSGILPICLNIPTAWVGVCHGPWHFKGGSGDHNQVLMLA